MLSAPGCCLCIHRSLRSSLLCSVSPADCKAKGSPRPRDHCNLEESERSGFENNRKERKQGNKAKIL